MQLLQAIHCMLAWTIIAKIWLVKENSQIMVFPLYHLNDSHYALCRNQQLSA